MKRVKMIFVLLFLWMLGGTAVWSFLSPDREFSDMENRTLINKPKLTVKAVLSGSYQKKYEKYLSDQIFFRDTWVGIYADMQHVLGKKEVNGVYLGKSGYLIEKYSEDDFDSVQEKVNEDILAGFLNTCMNVYGNSHVSCLFIPSKVEILKKKMPDFIDEYSSADVVQEVKKRLDSDAGVISLFDALKAHEDEYIFYRTDHHWTTLGAYYGFEAYRKMCGEKLPKLSEYDREIVYDDFLGTTYNKAHVHTKPDEVTIFHKKEEKRTIRIDENDGELLSDSFYFRDVAEKGFDRYQLFFSKNTGKIEVDTSIKNEKTLLVVKDSFANCFVPFLADYYEKIIMIDCRYRKIGIETVFRKYPGITDVLVLFNTEKFRKDTHLSSLQIKKEKLEAIRSGEKENGSGRETRKESESSEEKDDIFGDLISLD